MTRESKALKFDGGLDSKLPADATATDLVTACMIIDASACDGEPLMMHCRKIFDTDAPAEPVALKDWKIIRIAYQSGE